MDSATLSKFDLTYPGLWIAGSDRDWAGDTAHVLGLVEDEFVRAVSSYAMFEPLTANGVRQDLRRKQSKYERCLNGLYARAFVYSLDAISKLLGTLENLHPPDAVPALISEYESIFGHLKHIRDSFAHIEDRGRGVDKHNKRIPTNILVLSAFSERRLEVTASDGKLYGVEISEPTLLSAQRILQAIINAYAWE